MEVNFLARDMGLSIFLAYTADMHYHPCSSHRLSIAMASVILFVNNLPFFLGGVAVFLMIIFARVGCSPFLYPCTNRNDISFHPFFIFL